MTERNAKLLVSLNKTGFLEKNELVTEKVKHQLELGIEFDFIGGDGLYGNDLGFTCSKEDMGLVYLLDIHCDQKLHLEKPELYIPERKSNRVPAAKRTKANTPLINTNEYIKTLTPKDWKKINIRDSAKWKLKGLFHLKIVFIWDKESDAVEKRLLVISKRKTKQGEEIQE